VNFHAEKGGIKGKENANINKIKMLINPVFSREEQL
jgi:hypothetical protein